MTIQRILRRSIGRRAAVTAFVATMTAAVPTWAETSWDLPLAWPDGNFHVENAKTFAAEVEKATDGRVKINIHPGGSLGYKGPEMLAAVRDGLIPIGDILLNQQVGEAPILGLEAQPYIVADYAQLKTLHTYFRPAVEQVAQKFNQKILYMVPWPTQYVYTKKEIKAIEEFRGIKIRTYNKTTTGMFNAIGMTAVQLPWGEVVPSLAAGTIDSVTTSASSGVDGKFWEFLKYMYPTNHVWSSNIVSVNLDAWGKLGEKDRQAIESVATRLEPSFWDVSRAENDAKSKLLNERGVAMGTVTPEMMTGMREATAPMVTAFVEEVPGAKEILDAYFKDIGR